MNMNVACIALCRFNIGMKNGFMFGWMQGPTNHSYLIFLIQNISKNLHFINKINL